MTCIAGLVDPTGVYIGGDSAGVSGWDLTVRNDTKVFKRTSAYGDAWLFGFTTSFRMGQLIHYSLALPEFLTLRDPDEDSVFYTLVRSFVPNLRQCLKDGGFATKEKESESGGTFLLGVQHRLFMVGSDYQISESLNNFDACGAGSQIACGALYATPGVEPHQRIVTALEAAERLCAGVRGPFTIVTAPETNRTVG